MTEEEGPDDLDLMIEESERRSPGFRRRLRREIGRQSIRGCTARQRHLNRTRLLQRWRREDREVARKVAYMQWRMTHIYSRYAAPKETLMPPNCPTCGRQMIVNVYTGWGFGMLGPPYCPPCLTQQSVQVLEDTLAATRAKRAKRAKRSSGLPDFPPNLADNEDCDGPDAGEVP